MSRKGKIPIEVPKEIKVALENGSVRIEGPKGKIALNLPAGIKVEQKDNKLFVLRSADDKQTKSNHGTFRALILNMIKGAVKSHKKELQIQGLGFRGQVQGQKLTLTLGFSHPVEFMVPKDVKITLPDQTNIVLEGVDRSLVGLVAAQIRAIKRPEPYKGKGIRYLGERIKMKQGKAVTK